LAMSSGSVDMGSFPVDNHQKTSNMKPLDNGQQNNTWSSHSHWAAPEHYMCRIRCLQ
jgi:hypothetical protein